MSELEAMLSGIKQVELETNAAFAKSQREQLARLAQLRAERKAKRDVSIAFLTPFLPQCIHSNGAESLHCFALLARQDPLS